jgi:hypothetical protein
MTLARRSLLPLSASKPIVLLVCLSSLDRMAGYKSDAPHSSDLGVCGEDVPSRIQHMVEDVLKVLLREYL